MVPVIAARFVLAGLAFATVACARPRPVSPPPVVEPPDKITLAILAAESHAFPKAAAAATEALREATVAGIDDRQLSSVTLEVVQLSIECVEPTPTCYAEVGRTLAADRLLFAQIAKGSKRRQVKVTVTLFDVQTGTPIIVEKVFATEREATAGIGELVGEATR
jgi:hypothetical protein